MSNRIETITDLFNPISLVEINRRASLQTRADNKYFVPWNKFVELATTLSKSYSVMEIDGRRAFSYDTQYFDTPTLNSYWSHLQGRRKRFKCRSRIYDTGLCVFELKLKNGRDNTIKYKIGYSEAESKEVSPAAMQFLRKHLNDFYGMDLNETLVPTLHNNYQRVTFAADEGGERVTCDLNINFGDGQHWYGRLSEDCVLLEIKSANGRGYADQILWNLGVRPGSGSKYCLGLSLVRPDLRYNRFARTRNRYFVQTAQAEPVLSTLEVSAPVAPSAVPHPMPTSSAAAPLMSLPSTTVAMLE